VGVAFEKGRVVEKVAQRWPDLVQVPVETTEKALIGGSPRKERVEHSKWGDTESLPRR